MIGFVMFIVDGTARIARADEAVEPARMGVATLTLLRDCSVEELRDRVRDLRPRARDGRRSGTDAGAEHRLRHVLHQHPAELAALVLAAGIIEADPEAVTGSRDISWGYVIDLDHRWMEIYQGHQIAPHRDGRFIAWPRRNPDVWPPRLIAQFPLFAELPDNDTFLAAVAHGADASVDRYEVDGACLEEAAEQLRQLDEVIRRRRNAAHATGQPVSDKPIRIVIANATELLNEDPEAAALVWEVARTGQTTRVSIELHQLTADSLDYYADYLRMPRWSSSIALVNPQVDPAAAEATDDEEDGATGVRLGLNGDSWEAALDALQAWADDIAARPAIQAAVDRLARAGVTAVSPPLLQPLRQGQERVIEWANGSAMRGDDTQVVARLRELGYHWVADHLARHA